MKKGLSIYPLNGQKPTITLLYRSIPPEELFEKIKNDLLRKKLVLFIGEDAIPDSMRFDMSGDFSLYDDGLHFPVLPISTIAVVNIIERVKDITKTEVYAYEIEEGDNVYYNIIASTVPLKNQRRKNVKPKIAGFLLVGASLLVLIFLVYILKRVYTLEE